MRVRACLKRGVHFGGRFDSSLTHGDSTTVWRLATASGADRLDAMGKQLNHSTPLLYRTAYML